MSVELHWHGRAINLVQRVGKLETILLDLMSGSIKILRFLSQYCIPNLPNH